MSVTANYVRLSEVKLKDWRANPALINQWASDRDSEVQHVNIDKAADGLVWLLRRPECLTNETEAAGTGVLIRNRVPEMLEGAIGRRERALDFGYDPARVLSLDDVRETAARLEAVTDRQLRSAYDAKQMARDDVYPQIWMQEGDAAFTEYLLPYFAQLRKFFQSARDAEQVVVVFYS